MKYLISINEFFKFPVGEYTPQDYLKKYKDDCENDFQEIYNDEDWEKIIQILESDCSEFLDEMIDSESILFRGVRGGVNNIVNGLCKKQSRVNRRTLDMRSDVSKEFDNLFSGKFGVALRGSGTFATKQPLNANGYSDYIKSRRRSVNYIFLPIGDYRYFWNNSVMDLYSYIEHKEWYVNYDYLSPKGSEWMEDMYGRLRKRKDVLDTARKEMDKIVSGYMEGDLQKIEEQEITFVCKEYYLVDDAFLPKMIEWIESKYFRRDRFNI